jgi:anhydro-N-acetylmuramic acid kinase
VNPGQPNEIYVGLMSGTSLDGVDVAIADFSEFPPRLLYCATTPYTATLRAQLLELCRSQTVELDTLYSLDAELGETYAAVVNTSLDSAGLAAREVIAIGCHGQTIRHSPDSNYPYTAQIGDPNRITAMTGITTVADFRSKDIALGGQAAPLAPGFHRFLFRSDEENRVVVNVGGIANITGLPADATAPVLGFDTGPGNTLLDYWTERHTNASFDAAGTWARSGRINSELLDRMLAEEPYFHLDPPKSTGTEYFNPTWLHTFLSDESNAAGIQATLVELSAVTIAAAIRGLPAQPRHGYLCGGGVHNLYLFERLQLALPDCGLATTQALGLDPDFVEASAFAWLARERMNQRPGNIPEVTRARRDAILGGVYAADKHALTVN